MNKRFARGRITGRALTVMLALGAVLAAVAVAGAARTLVDPPANVVLPSIVGDPTVGSTVNGEAGEWTGAESYSFRWLRCTAAGDGCAPIPGATTANYTIVAADATLSIRFEVTAHNTAGTKSAQSVAATVRTASGETNSVPVTSLTARPDHLLISALKFSPSPFGNPGGELTVEVQVTLEGTTKGVSGALVYITPVPYDWAHASAEVPTATDGRVAIKIKTTTKLPHKGALVMQIRARAPGNTQQDILGGISTRRLVQVSLK